MEGDTVLVSLHTTTPASSTGIDVADTLPIDDIYQQVFQQARQYISASALPDISDVILATSFDGLVSLRDVARLGLLHAVIPVGMSLPDFPPPEAQQYPEYQQMLKSLLKGELDVMWKEREDRQQELINGLMDATLKLTKAQEDEDHRQREDVARLLDELEEMKKEYQAKVDQDV